MIDRDANGAFKLKIADAGVSRRRELRRVQSASRQCSKLSNLHVDVFAQCMLF